MMPGASAASQERPARTVVRAELPSGAACLGEWTETADALGVVVLLHDYDRDLDDLRAVAHALAGAGLAVLNVDLPGHGISAGAYWTDGTAAVGAAAAFAQERGYGAVGLVAAGLSCSVLAGASVGATAAVLVDPLSCAESPPRDDVWTTVPSVLIQDPRDDAVTAEIDEIVAQTRAWTLRVHLHRDEQRPRLDAPQIVAATAKFMLEQFTYAAARQGRWSTPTVERSRRVDG
jgi:hypothetical protein